MVPASAQVRVLPERKDGGHPALCNAPPQWLRMRHQSHQSHLPPNRTGDQRRTPDTYRRAPDTAALRQWHIINPSSPTLSNFSPATSPPPHHRHGTPNI